MIKMVMRKPRAYIKEGPKKAHNYTVEEAW